ncbi:melanocortin receptor 4-like [Oculina patagonica]
MVNESATGYVGDGDKNSRLETIVIINCVLNAPLMLISIIGNTLVLAAIVRTPSLRSPSTIFLCSLAFSDFLAGFVVQPVYIANELTNDSLYNIRNITTLSVCGASLFTITAISVDRFLALHYHMRYPNLMTTHRAIYTSATLWTVSFLLSFLTFWNIRAFCFAMATGIVICILISNFCYIQIYRIVRHHTLEIHSQQQAVESNAENYLHMLRSKKTAIHTFIYYIVMILCYTPFFISMSIAAISIDSWTNMWILAETVSYMNSSINPFLYCWRLRELRTAVVKTARHMLCKQTAESSQ